jgi:hypothetical protein
MLRWQLIVTFYCPIRRNNFLIKNWCCHSVGSNAAKSAKRWTRSPSLKMADWRQGAIQKGAVAFRADEND